MGKIQEEIKRLEDLGVISSSIGGKDIGKVIDLHNQNIEKRKDKRFGSQINAMNKYFAKLAQHSLRNPGIPYKSYTIVKGEKKN